MPTTATDRDQPTGSPSRRRLPIVRLVRHGVTTVAVACVLIALPQTAATGNGQLTTRVTAETSARQVVAGADVTVSGTVTPTDTDAARAVLLEIRTATGWRVVSQGSTTLDGSYTLPVPTDWYATHELRVIADGIPTAQPGASEVQTVEVSPPYQPQGSSSSWKQFPTQARWDPCTVVEYRTNLRKAPKGSLAQISRAFAAVHAATGLTFRRAGSTSKVPFSRAPQKRQFLTEGLVVAWTTPQAVPALAGDTAGFGGATYRSAANGASQYVYGGVAIDATRKAGSNGASTQTLLMHEIAHAMGLTHVSDRTQIMYPYLRSHKAQYEAGDLAGLRAVGAEQGCF